MSTPLAVPNVLHDKRFAVVDVEGNGQNPPEIIEFGLLTVDGPTYQADAVRSWLIRPQQPITSIVTRKVHGIRNDDVAGAPVWNEVAPEIGIAIDGRILVAHSAKVEQSVVGQHLPEWTPPLILDTLRFAKQVWPGLGGYSLDKLIVHGGLDTSAVKGQGYHRAAYDTWAAWLLLCRLTVESGLDWPGVINAAALPEFIPDPEPEGGLW
ncbi:3'-5' exonuclease [Nocardia sp. alder85J]|uniref:3'-5' exonuclease n=1 Tax=Nocardia sp. alder85J TaxID=2862949 RepID=UPI001CD7C892|nr:3'-5' exonuclease [Nocardia sp. alder85J]MCX4096280.1 3'-5' exonuclease [Nocardia sp. alder85J]